MRIYANLRIGAKLFLGFASCVLVLLLLTLIGNHTLQALRAMQDEGAQRALDAQEALQTVAISNQLYSVIADAEINHDLAQTRAAWAQTKRQTETLLSSMQKRVDTEEERRWVQQASDAYREAVRLFEQEMMPQLQTTRMLTPEIRALDGKIDAQMRGIREPLEKVCDSIGKESKEADGRFDQVGRRSSISSLLLALLGLGICIASALLVTRSLVVPLKRVVESLDRLRSRTIAHLDEASRAMAQGNLSADIDTAIDTLEIDRRDEIGMLAHSINTILTQTQTTVSSFEAAQGTLRSLIDETGSLIEAAKAGQLSQRGHAEKYQGSYRDLVEGINATLDAVVTPIHEAAAVLERMAGRDLSTRMTGRYQGDFATIQTALNRAIDNLDEGLQQVAQGAEQVAGASVEISGGSQNLSQGASEQAGALEEVSSSLQEMAATTRQNAANAHEAQALSASARQAANEGQEAMSRLTQAIERIRQSSAETAQIVKTIDDIAFQTNLLALNAAVEAARAGDAGKGFAVVAEEVRNLAMRSAEAAKTTAARIEEVVKNAQSGVALNTEVRSHLEAIAEQSNRVSEVMGEVATASEQQRLGVEQVTHAVGELDGLTQQNAATAEESASAAEELSSQAEEMQSMVAAFQLNSSQRVTISRPQPERSAQPVASVRRMTLRFPRDLVLAGPSPLHGRPSTNGSSLPSEALIPFDDDADSQSSEPPTSAIDRVDKQRHGSSG